MNTVRIPHLLKQATVLLTFLGSTFLITACGGDGGKSSKSSSSSSSSISSHTFSSTAVKPPLDGNWPNVKVSSSGTKSLRFDWTAAPDAAYYKLFKKQDANSAYVQVGSDFNATTVSDTVSVHLTDWVNSLYKVQACTAANVCSDSTEVNIDSAMISAITYVKASNTEANDWFGWSVALSRDGKTLAVGAPAESSNAVGINGDQSSNTTPTSGAVYVFVMVDGNWVQEAYLKASNTEQPLPNSSETVPNDRFGYQISLSDDGNTLAVSAINEDSPSSGINCDQSDEVASFAYSSNGSTYTSYVHYNYEVGAIYIFKRNNATWTQTAYLKPDDTSEYLDRGLALTFGSHISLSGDGKTLAVGNENDFYSRAGVLMVSKSSASGECVDYQPVTSSSSSVSSSSSSVNVSSLSSSSVDSTVIGGTNSGGVYVFRETDSGWLEEARIKASDAFPHDNFGASLDLSQDGSTLVVGAIGAEVFVTNSSSSSVKATATVTYLGSNYQVEMNSGVVYVYKRTGDIWQEANKIVAVNQSWHQQFGYALAISDDGKTLAVGTPGDWSRASGTNGSPTDFTYEAGASSGNLVPIVNTSRDKSSFASGAAFVYKYSDDTNTWVQEGYLKASNPRSGVQFGSSLSLSGNGDVLAVGCYQEASLASGINGDQLDTSSQNSGATYVFKRSASTWTQQSYVKAPNNSAEDRFGRALGLDFTGDILAIGAHREASNATGIGGDKSNNAAPSAGAVYIY